MRFERMFRLTMMAGVAWALPVAAPSATAAAAAAPGQALPQSTPQSAEDYQWIDRADALWDAIGDAPPDFAFAFEGAEPWAWQTTDGYTIIVEDAGEGGIRSYYFAPGARGPFLAVEPGMSFAYEGGRLAMVYDADGEAAPRGEFDDYDDPAGDLYDRALRVRDAMNGRDYRPVDADAWVEASPFLFSFIQSWDIGRSRYPGWARYHSRSDAAAWRRRFEAEQRRRRDQALRFRHWREGGFQGPPPGRFHRPGGPNRPGTGRPPQPGSGWARPGGRPDGPGRPGRPGRPGAPGTNPPPRPGMPIATPDGPGGGMRPPMVRPGNERPDGTPGWRRGRPNQPVPPVTTPETGAAPGPETRPLAGGNGWGNGWRRPSQPGASGDNPGRPNWTRPSRPEGWQRPPAPVGTPSPAPTPPAAGEGAPGRPNWTRPSRPEGWQRPSAPTPPAAVEGAPGRPSWSRPSRPEGGWQRPTAPSAAPQPGFTPRPSAPPPQAAPAPRPSYSPPPQRSSPPPQPRPAPPPRKMSSEDGTPL